MSDISGRRVAGRAALALAAGAGALVIAGTSLASASAAVSPRSASASPGSPAVVRAPQRVAGPMITLASGGYGSGGVACPSGTQVYGGGEVNSALGTMLLTDSWPDSSSSWRVYMKNTGTAAGSFIPFAVCR